MAAAGAGASESLLDAQHAEALACLKALEQAASLGMQRVILEIDAINVVNALGSSSFDRSCLGLLFRANMLFDFSICSVSHCPRACKSVAHSLAAIGLNCDNPLMWLGDVPEHVDVMVSREMRG